MPVFLRWLLIDIIVMRILRHRRVRPYVDRAYPVMRQYTTRFGRRIGPTMTGGYSSLRRRRRLSCCSGCLAVVAALTLGVIMAVVAVHWAWSM